MQNHCFCLSEERAPQPESEERAPQPESEERAPQPVHVLTRSENG